MSPLPLRSLIFTFYLICKTSFGLILHPYQTIQTLYQGHSLFLFVITPTIYFTLATLIWRFVLRPFVTHFLTASCPLMLIKTTIVFFALFWQLSLIYLLTKFIFNQKKG
jgi:hypothetical protein